MDFFTKVNEADKNKYDDINDMINIKINLIQKKNSKVCIIV